MNVAPSSEQTDSRPCGTTADSSDVHFFFESVEPQTAFRQQQLTFVLVFISVAMSSLSDCVIVVGGSLVGSSASQHVFFLKTLVATWYCWTQNVSSVTAQKEFLFGTKSLASHCFHGGKLTHNAFFFCLSQ